MTLLTAKETRKRNLNLVHDAWKAKGKKSKDLALLLDISPSFLGQLLSGFRAIRRLSFMARTTQRFIGALSPASGRRFLVIRFGSKFAKDFPRSNCSKLLLTVV